ncbi:C40 family peptidase [Paenibacillus sp. PR3]|uniref:C40 family peptidase n=1 Tax=Paenibacillus terricola TaxID=2763503 RepID=A0ABR8N0W3_9BACL|nr:C40 family peptidase [Paenibacillus terricola]MBD3921830.1 C40 family peptidase [Paenibacillus terricola]
MNFKKSVMGKTLAAAFLALTVSTASIGGILPTEKAHAATASQQSTIVSTAKKYLGTPYKFGASTSTTAVFDCSSFTKRVFSKIGVSLPRDTKQQIKVGKYVSKSNLQVGDLVFFYSPTHHVGIYIGNGKIIHTYGAGGVKVSSITSGWWSKYYNQARRVA